LTLWASVGRLRAPAGRIAAMHAKSIPALRQAGYEDISDLPRIQQSYREKALVVITPAMRICATSNGEQLERVQVLIPVVQGLSQKQRQLMQQYFELVDWQGLNLPTAERRQRDSLNSFERSVEVWKVWRRPYRYATLASVQGTEITIRLFPYLGPMLQYHTGKGVSTILLFPYLGPMLK